MKRDERSMTVSSNPLREAWRKNWPELDAALRGGLPSFVVGSRPDSLGDEVPVFVYHVVTAEEFDADLRFLKSNGYRTLCADALLEHLRNERRASPGAVVLSVDDGSRNLYDVVFPLLRQFEMCAVAFIATAYHGLAGDTATRARPEWVPVDWSRIREMHRSGLVDFQSHTHGHRYLPRWPQTLPLEGSDPSVVTRPGLPLRIEEDFRASKETLEERLEKSVRHMAFPGFSGTENAIRVGGELGYEAFWWGVLPGRPVNRPGDPPTHIVRLDGRYLRRLPGEGRRALADILRERFRGSAARIRRRTRPARA